MALNLSKDYTFSPNTTISSSEVNTDFDELYNAFSGLEAGTSSMSKLPLDADPTSALYAATKQYVDAYANYRRPVLKYISATTVDVENNTGTSNQTKIIFPDGNYRTVTEDTSSSNKYRRFDITADAEFTSGTEESGLRAALSEATDTWYAIYAVKSTINTANFVLVGDTTLPIQASVSALNGFYGTNGWVYLGLIRNGDQDTVTGDILNFVQYSDGTTQFNNIVVGNVTGTPTGILIAGTASGTSITKAVSRGTGAAQIPNNIDSTQYQCLHGAAGVGLSIFNSAGTKAYHRRNGITAGVQLETVMVPADESIQFSWTTASTGDLVLCAFHDTVLGVGSNPFI
jgi:hypothetical protein